MPHDSHELNTLGKLLSALSGQLSKTREPQTRRELMKQMRLLLDKVDRIVAEDLSEK